VQQEPAGRPPPPLDLGPLRGWLCAGGERTGFKRDHELAGRPPGLPRPGTDDRRPAAWRLEPVAGEELGYRYYSRLAGDRGMMGAGLQPHSVTLGNGTAHLTAQEGSRGTSWSGLWYSLAGTAREAGLVLDPRATLPGRVARDLQVSLASWTARVKGNGRLKIELRSAHNDLLADWSVPVNSSEYTSITRSITGDIGPVKLLNVVAESPADLTLDEITIETRVPELTPLRYAFLLSYAQLMRCYDPATGLVRDDAQ
jgi:hypothetical protein